MVQTEEIGKYQEADLKDETMQGGVDGQTFQPNRTKGWTKVVMLIVASEKISMTGEKTDSYFVSKSIPMELPKKIIYKIR